MWPSCAAPPRRVRWSHSGNAECDGCHVLGSAGFSASASACSVLPTVARVGETIEKPVTGERITWIETAQSTDGKLLAFELYLRPGAAVAAEHRHLRQTEDFIVLDGTIR